MSRTATHTFLLILGLTALRIGLLLVSPLNLHGDEAQYLAWSRDPAFGYFSKPPMIAWMIGLTTALFGTAEWAVRLGSPICHAVTAGLLFATARRVKDDRAGFWAALVYLTMPGVFLSSAIASTDVVLLVFVAMAVHAWVALRQGGGGWRILQLGMAIGLGLLSKYAMLFVVAGLALVWITDRETRAAFPAKRTALSALIAGVIFAPNIVWNARNGFATAGHTVANANTGGALFNPGEAAEFVVSQFGVMGPILFALLILSILRAKSGTMRGLALLALTPLVLITLQAFLSRANANWAAAAYASGCVLVAVDWRPKVLLAGIILNTVIGMVMIVGGFDVAISDRFGTSNSYKRLRAWPETVAAIADYAEGFDAVATDKRIYFYDLDYYGLGGTLPLYKWQVEDAPQDHADLTRSLPDGFEGRVLMAVYSDVHLPDMRRDFATFTRVGDVAIPVGAGKLRRLELWAGEGYARAPRR